MKKRILSWILVLMMLLSLLPVAAFAAYDTAGQTFTSNSNDPTQLPAVSAQGLVWEGPDVSSICGQQEHTHTRGSCYALICGGLSYTHRRHNSSCYTDVLTCTRAVHQHGSGCYGYQWTLIEEEDAQWRNWWPLYWGYDVDSSITDIGAVSNVTAGGATAKFTTTEVKAADALKDNTITVGDAVSNGIHVVMTPGYYVESYRFVCGNHTGCGVTSHSERTRLENSSGNYTSEFVVFPSTGEFDHWAAIDGITANANSWDFYIPLEKPTGKNIYDKSGNNILYPFYLLLEVAQDELRYDVRYDWGQLADQLTAAVPASDYDLLRNASHTVQAPSDAALAEADGLTYTFAGWKVEGSGYDADASVDPGNLVTIYGSDITLVAQWEEKVDFTVTYTYNGNVPANADPLPQDGTYHENDLVTVAPVPAAVEGYIFTGWTMDGQTAESSFSMPANNVTLVGTWRPDDNANKDLSYTIKYWFNGFQNLTEYPDVVVTDTVWMHAADTLTVDKNYIKTVENFQFVFTDPEEFTDYATAPETISNGSVLNVYYVGTHASVHLDKNVTWADGTTIAAGEKAKVGDTLRYTITLVNQGNATIAAPFVVEDTANGEGEIAFVESENENVSWTQDQNQIAGTQESQWVDIFTFQFSETNAFAPGDTASVTYTYTVQPEDAGKILRNAAFWDDRDSDTDVSADTTEVPVENRYTLTVEHYADGTLVNTSDAVETFQSQKLNENTTWTVTVGGTGGTYNAPKSFTFNGVTYAFDDPATTDALSGTLTADATVKLYYAKDEIGKDDQPDEIPDKYQVTVRYETETGGTITGITEEVLTIYDAEGNYATQGSITTSGSAVQTEDKYDFAGWTLDLKDHAPVSITGEDENLSAMALSDVGGGETYIFTAKFNHRALTVTKAVSHKEAKVGDFIHYEIHIHNTGTSDLTNVTLTDVITGDIDRSKIIYPVESGQNNHSPDGILASFDKDTGYISVESLPSGKFANLLYAYEIQPEDAGKTITNTVTVAKPEDIEEDPADNTTETSVTTQYTLTVEHYADGTLVNTSDAVETFQSQKLNGNTGWTVTVGGTDGTYNAPKSFTFNGVTYAFDDPATTDALSGTLTADATVKLYYAKDEIGKDDQPDEIPDKYQVIVTYTSSNREWGTVNKTVEVFNLPEGAEELEITAAATATPVAKGAYFKEWTLEGANVSRDRDLDYTFTATGGSRHDFVAVFKRSGSPILPVVPSKPNASLNMEDHYAYIVGYPDGTVKPQGNITRAEVATIFFRMLTDESREQLWCSTNHFSDVKEGDWFNHAVSTLTNAGILDGYPDGTFLPNGNITRAEFAKIAASFFRFADDNHMDNPFSDVPNHAWYTSYVLAAREMGLIEGYPDGTYRPMVPITRAEAMTIVNHTLGRAPHKDHLLPDMIVWPDNPSTAWYYEAVQEATNSHEYTMHTFAGDRYEAWSLLLPVRNWAAFERQWVDANAAIGGDVMN